MTPTPHSVQAGLAAVDALLQPFNRADSPGLIVGIAHEGRAIYRRGVGLACIEQGVAMSPRTRVRIASTSKHFTSVAILLLAEEGKLDIDDLIYQHLPELPRLHPAGPTLRQLMQHTGGWRTDLAAVVNGLALEPTADWSQPLRTPHTALNFEPGSRMVYSNAGYQLLARVIERISGQAFGDFLKARIFAPLDLHDTESVTSDFEIRPGMALQYQMQPDGSQRRGMYPGELRGSGSLVSTIDDMLRWLAHLRSPVKTVGSAASWAQMLTLPALSTGMAMPYALGLFRHPYRGVEVIHHAGAVLGATSQMITVPSHALDIMIMANGAPVSTVALGFQIIDALLGDAQLGAPVEHLPSAGHDALIGKRYHAAATGALIGFDAVAGKLALSWFGGRPAPLRREGGDAVLASEDSALNPVLIALDQLRIGEAAPAVLTISDGGHLLRCERLPDTPDVDAGELGQQLAGRYRAPDLEADAHIELLGDLIVLQLQGRQGRNAYRLKPLSAQVMLAEAMDPMLGAIGGSGIVNVDREAGSVIGLRLDTTRLRQLRITREKDAA